MIPAPIVRVAVIGAGTAGRDFALRCVGAGFSVVLEDVMPARLRHAEEIYNALPHADATGTLTFAHTVEEAVRHPSYFPPGADLAIDFVPDELESKLEIFSMLDRMAPPSTILLTPTETLSITDLASCVYRPERCFAVRGSLTPGQPVSLIVPKSGHPTLALSAHVFLRRLGMVPTVLDDTEAPMLVKNVL